MRIATAVVLIATVAGPVWAQTRPDGEYYDLLVENTLTCSDIPGKQDRSTTAVDDDSCVGEQGNWWYDTTDSRFEFCNADSGVPSVVSGSFSTIDSDYGDETVTSDWDFRGAGSTGAMGAYDLDIGTTTSYGGVRIGDMAIYHSSYATGNIDLDSAFVWRNEGTLGVGNDPGIEFALMESISNNIRLAIPESASGNATAFIRSGTFAGPYSTAIGNDIVTCDQWTTYNGNIDCDTSGTGADLFVQDDVELEGTLFLHETINFEGATADGNQVILQVGADPGADVTITLPTTTGTLAYGDVTAVGSCASGDCYDGTTAHGSFFIGSDSNNSDSLILKSTTNNTSAIGFDQTSADDRGSDPDVSMSAICSDTTTSSNDCNFAFNTIADGTFGTWGTFGSTVNTQVESYIEFYSNQQNTYTSGITGYTGTLGDYHMVIWGDVEYVEVQPPVWFVSTTANIYTSPDGTCSQCGPDNSDNWSCSSVTCPATAYTPP